MYYGLKATFEKRDVGYVKTETQIRLSKAFNPTP